MCGIWTWSHGKQIGPHSSSSSSCILSSHLFTSVSPFISIEWGVERERGKREREMEKGIRMRWKDLLRNLDDVAAGNLSLLC